MNIATLEREVSARFPGAVLADHDADSAYFLYPGERGLRRIRFAELGGGRVALTEAEQLKPRYAPYPRGRKDKAMANQHLSVEQRLAVLEASTAALKEAASTGAKPAARAQSQAGADYAPLPPSLWGEVAPRRPYQPTPVAPFGTHKNAAELAALGSLEAGDFASFPASPWDVAPTIGSGEDFAPIPPNPWD